MLGVGKKTLVRAIDALIGVGLLVDTGELRRVAGRRLGAKLYRFTTPDN
jgi:hypothetical protein